MFQDPSCIYMTLSARNSVQLLEMHSNFSALKYAHYNMASEAIAVLGTKDVYFKQKRGLKYFH
jgi:hypothetical protein